METWAVLSQKGGAGKTTIALHLAVAAMHAGRSVLVVDLDPQQSAMKWSNIREQDAPKVVPAVMPDLNKVLADAGKRFDLVIIDTSPRADRDCIEVCRKADLVILPVRPALWDVVALEETMHLIDLAGQTAKNVIVLNAVATRTSEGEEAAGLLSQRRTVLKSRIGDRVDIRRAIANGQTVTEFAPSTKAAAEMTALYEEIAKQRRLVHELEEGITRSGRRQGNGSSR
jgi:chromosome partitioning protein